MKLFMHQNSFFSNRKCQDGVLSRFVFEKEVKWVLTACLRRLVVRLADELVVLHQVELVARVQLALAEDAREALQVVHVVLRPPHHLRRRDPLLAARALGAETPVTTRKKKERVRETQHTFMQTHKWFCICKHTADRRVVWDKRWNKRFFALVFLGIWMSSKIL